MNATRNMTRIPHLGLACILLVGCGFLTQARAQTPSAPPPPGAVHTRLFLAFAEDAGFVPQQWWEGRLGFTDGDPVDATVGELVVAVRPYRRVEAGLRVGFGSTDAPGRLPEGSGATDLDLWAKWHVATLGEGARTDVAVGALVTVPTGDDTAGLGQDAFGLALFGAIRHGLAREARFVAHAALRFNEDGRTLGVRLEGRTSARLGLGLLVPLDDTFQLIGEVVGETERFRRQDADFRLLGGVQWGLTERGYVRAALALGLTDGAPDGQLLVGYAFAL